MPALPGRRGACRYLTCKQLERLAYNGGMRFVRKAGSDPAFLVKAMSEASGELRELYWGMRPGDLLRVGAPPDEDWCLMAIAQHMRDTEERVGAQLERLTYTRRREPDIPHVDFDDIPFREDYEEADEDELLEEFHYLRRRTTHLLWALDEAEWDRGGTHPYRGRLTVRDIARELYQHDLEHLWQARRMVDHLAAEHRGR